jgi:methylase of polypeptide subunit release factors
MEPAIAAPRQREARSLSIDTPEIVERVRRVLQDTGYTESRVLEVFQAPEFFALPGPGEQPLALHRTHGGSPLDTLLRLLLLGRPVDVETASRAVRPTRLEEWVALGLLRPEGEAVIAPLTLQPVGDLVLIHDSHRRYGFSPEYVMGVARTSLNVANLTIRRSCTRVLDVGCGGGFQAFLAARHSDQVVAVDRNPRAVNLARFNAQLNGLANVEVLEGDFFEPVGDQQFDLIVSNPPYVVSPENSFIFRDSGLPGDALCRKIIREASQQLREGGYCQFMCTWAHLSGEDWRERLAGWFTGTGCDAWVLRFETLDPAVYATAWIRESELGAPQMSAERFAAWLAYYERERIEALSNGWITLRKASGQPNWFRCDDAPELLPPCGESIARGFEARDFLERASRDETLLETRLHVASDVCAEEECQPSPPEWTTTARRLRLTQGLAYACEVNADLLALVGRCDGERPLRILLDDLAATLGQPVADIALAALQVVRRLIEQGFLLAPPEKS